MKYEEMTNEELHRLLLEKCREAAETMPVTDENRETVIAFLRMGGHEPE